MSDNFFDLPDLIRETFDINQKDIREYSPLSFAFIGDCVYELAIRTYVLSQGNRPVNELNKMKVKYVNAAAQTDMVDACMDIMTQEEQDIFKKGRNAKGGTVAKNQSVADYRKATGFEALCGYLYMQGRMDRVVELVKYGIEHPIDHSKKPVVFTGKDD